MRSSSTMSTQEANRWRQLEEIFNGVLQRSADERNRYLAQVCGGDTFMLDEVKSLISSYETNDDFLAASELSTGLNLLAELDSVSHAGETVGRFFLKERIGRGGMGDVYLAHEPDLDRQVAVKLLPPSFNQDPEWIARFRLEARAASRISHPNVAHVYEVGEADGRHFIAMEYIDGVTLRERIKAAPIDPGEAVSITIQIARALSAAHAEGVSHRDIKPENVMIHRDGYLKVLDFGLAQLSAGFRPDQLALTSSFETTPGIILGSPAYMSPEQARGKAIDTRTDLWSLGVVFYELLTGRSPFLSETPSDTIAAILKVEPPPPRQLAPALNVEFDRILGKLLAKNAEERFPNAAALIDELISIEPEARGARSGSLFRPAATLRRSVETAPDASPSSARGLAEPTRKVTPARAGLRRWKWHLLGLVLISLVAVGVWVSVRKGNPPVAVPHERAITSIAVLPFVNATGDPDTEFVSDGLSENLIERFSRLSRVKVIARGSSFQYKRKTAEPKTIANELGVQGLILGKVTRQGDDLLITVELMDPNDAELYWTGRYRYKASDLPNALNDISRQLATNLNLDLTGEELNLVAGLGVANGTAYEWYLKGRFLWNQFTEDSLVKSLDCFEQAIKIDPKYALAFAALADSHLALGANYRPDSDQFTLAESSAAKALQLDDQLAEAHCARAAIRYVHYWDLSAAEQGLRRSLELKPNYADAHSLQHSIHLSRGEINEAMHQLDRAITLDPLSLLFKTQRYYLLYSQHDYERAVAQIQEAIKQNAATGYLYSDLALVYARMGRTSDALEANERATHLTGSNPETITTQALIYGFTGNLRKARSIAESLEAVPRKSAIQPYGIASIYAAIGDRELAFKWLERAGHQRSPYMLRVRVDPSFDKIRSEPRFEAILNSTSLK